MAVALSVAGFVFAPNLYLEPTPLTPDANPTIEAAQLARYATEHSAWQAAVSTTRTGVLAALAGIGALVTIGINLRNSNIQLVNARVAAQTLATTQRTFQITERGHQTGRYTAAIEQLGNAESIAIRLGGIYALQQLAVDSGRRGDQTTVVEVLSAFVRIAPSRPHFIASLGPVGARAAPADTSDEPSEGPEPDVQAAVTVLGRLPRLDGVACADLTRTKLSGADLSGADLCGARLGGANLSGAWLVEADLSGARLHGTDLNGADLRRADLSGARLGGADLSGAHLGGATLAGANLDGADLTGARLYGATLSGADLREADLFDARLTGAILANADLGGADLTGADLAGADLSGARLGRATLTGANLDGAVLRGARMRGAMGVALSVEQLSSVAIHADGTEGTPYAGSTASEGDSKAPGPSPSQSST